MTIKSTQTKAQSATQKAKTKDFVGTWQLQDWRETDSEGNVQFPFGEDAYGRITYTTDGFMHAVLMKVDREHVGVDTAKLKTARERLLSPTKFLGALPMAGAMARYAKASSGFVCYGGGFYIKDEAQVVHTVDYSLIPDWIGGQQVRKYTFQKDGQLILAADFGGKMQRLTWARI